MFSSIQEPSKSWQEDFGRDGFAIVTDVVAPSTVMELIAATSSCATASQQGVLDRRGEVYGVRDLIGRVEAVLRLASSRELMALVAPILGPGAFAVRGLYFDKTPETNWNLPWH